MLFVGSGTTVWKVGRQALVTLLTAESEFIQMSAAVQDIRHILDLLDGLGFLQTVSKLYEDNQATIQIAENPYQRGRTKHLGRRYQFVREAIDNNEVILIYCPTESNVADIFTKPLGHKRFIHLRSILLGYEGLTVK